MAVSHRGRTICAAVIATVVVGLGAGAVRLLWSSPEPVHPLETQIEQLRGENGLYMRPGLLGSVGQPSVADSAYGLSLLAAAGQPAAAPWGSAAAVAAAEAATAEASVWGSWYVTQIEAATQSALPGDWHRAVLESLQTDGYFHDSSQPANDFAADLATTAAAVEVLAAKGVDLSMAQTDALDAWLHEAARIVVNPYQACNAASGLNHLSRLESETATALSHRWLSSLMLPGELDSYEDILDVVGVACLLRLLGPNEAGVSLDGAAIRRVLQPALARPVDDVQLLSSVAKGWTLAGGAPAELRRLAAVVAGRVDPSTNLIRGVVARLGTLENSYYVMEIRRIRSLPTRDDRLAAGVRRAIGEFGQSSGPNARLMAAVILRLSGDRDPQLEQHAIAGVLALLTGPMAKDDLPSWALAVRLLAQLDVTVPAPRLSSWPVQSGADRFDAWAAMSLTSTADDQPDEFGHLIDDLPQVLSAEVHALAMGELRVGVAALAAHDRADRIPVPALRQALDTRRGCPGLPDLFRPVADADCDLKATADALWLATFLDNRGGVH